MADTTLEGIGFINSIRPSKERFFAEVALYAGKVEGANHYETYFTLVTKELLEQWKGCFINVTFDHNELVKAYATRPVNITLLNPRANIRFIEGKPQIQRTGLLKMVQM